MDAAALGPNLRPAIARAPDVRSRHGRRHPLSALQARATAAMVCGARTLYAIAKWGRLQPEAVRRALGFRGRQMSGVTMLHDVYKRLNVDTFERELQAWAAQTLDGQQQLVLDGKALRGIHGETLPGVRLVALYAAEAGLVLATYLQEAGWPDDHWGLEVETHVRWPRPSHHAAAPRDPLGPEPSARQHLARPPLAVRLLLVL